MPLVSRKSWTLRRKLMGNLIPLVLSIPFGVWGVLLMIKNERIAGPELLLIGAMSASAWLTMNLFGLFQNAAIKREIARRRKLGPAESRDSRFFVGFSRPTFRGALDPHEDLGYLILRADRIEFMGDTLEAALRRSEIVGIRYRPNIHTFVGLGRWIALEGRIDGKPVRMLIEPRERASLLGNLLFSKKLKSRLETWLKENGPRV